MNFLGKLMGFIVCVLAIETAVSKWNDCSSSYSSIPTAMMFTGLSGLLFLSPGHSVFRPKVQLVVAFYNSVNVLRNVQNLFSLNEENPSFGRCCSHGLILATIFGNVIVFSLWSARVIQLVAFIAHPPSQPSIPVPSSCQTENLLPSKPTAQQPNQAEASRYRANPKKSLSF